MMDGQKTSWPEQLAPFFSTELGASVPGLQPQRIEREHVRWSSATAYELLTFWVDGQLHAMRIRTVVEVAKLPPVTKVPRLQPGVLGVITLRGTLVPIIDAAHYFAPPQAAHKEALVPSHVVVLGAESAPLGLAVGRIVGVSRLPQEAVVPRAKLNHKHEDAQKACIEGFATSPQGADIVLLDAEALLQRFTQL